MAGVTCLYCGATNAEGEQLCQECFRKLPAPDGAPVPDTATPDSDSDAGSGVVPEPGEAVEGCPHCGAEVPDPANQVCVECHEPLGGPRSLRVAFPGGEVTVHAGQSVTLGRDPEGSPVSAVFADRDNVSRRHATLGVDSDGAWVRDERSTNGTYVNDVPVPPGTRVTLTDGDTLRLAADLTATVHLP